MPACTPLRRPRRRACGATSLSQLGLREPVQLVGSFDRPNLVYRVLPRANLKRQILDVLARHPDQSGIIYCLSRREVDELAAWLRDEGHRALPYHAGLADEERHRNQDAFLNEDIDIIVATVAFGMGIDRSDVRFVVHAGAPQSLEHYQQESGRAGRDGLEAECVLFTSAADFMKWRVMLERNGEMTEERRSLMRDMERYAARVGCRHRHIVQLLRRRLRARATARPATTAWVSSSPLPSPSCWREKSCPASRESDSGSAPRMSPTCSAAANPSRSRRAGTGSCPPSACCATARIDEVRGYIDQLLAHGLLQQTDDAYPVLRLTDEGAQLMRSGVAGRSFRSRGSASRQGPCGSTRPHRGRIVGGSGSRQFSNACARCGCEIARSRGVPPYVIFHDATLRELARLKPKSMTDLAHVYGMGARKIDAHGGAVLETINGQA